MSAAFSSTTVSLPGALLTAPPTPLAPPDVLPVLDRDSKLPVSATLAPLSILVIRLRVLMGLMEGPESFAFAQAVLSKLVRRLRWRDVRGLSDGPRGLCSPYESTGDTDKSRSRRGMGRGMGTGATPDCPRGETMGLTVASASPKDDDNEGGGTEGYVSSKALGTVPAAPPIESDEAGVVILVA